jgi:hypothetical protein
MTEMHADFLPASGAVVIVVCATSNVISHHVHAFEQQLKFARSISKKVSQSDIIADIPILLLLVDDDSTGEGYINAVFDFPAVVTINDYTAAALANAVRVLFDS